MTAPTATVPRRLQRSTSLPTKGIATADTTMNVVNAADSVERLTSKSSDIGRSISPKANREPPLKNRMVNPAASISQL